MTDISVLCSINERYIVLCSIMIKLSPNKLKNIASSFSYKTVIHMLAESLKIAPDILRTCLLLDVQIVSSPVAPPKMLNIFSSDCSSKFLCLKFQAACNLGMILYDCNVKCFERVVLHCVDFYWSCLNDCSLLIAVTACSFFVVFVAVIQTIAEGTPFSGSMNTALCDF